MSWTSLNLLKLVLVTLTMARCWHSRHLKIQLLRALRATWPMGPGDLGVHLTAICTPMRKLYLIMWPPPAPARAIRIPLVSQLFSTLSFVICCHLLSFAFICNFLSFAIIAIIYHFLSFPDICQLMSFAVICHLLSFDGHHHHHHHQNCHCHHHRHHHHHL